MSARSPFCLLGPHAGLASILVIEMAVALVVFQLAWQAYSHWQDRLHADSGIDEAQVLVLAPLGAGASDADLQSAVSMLAGLPDVRGVARVNQVPYGGSSWNTTLAAQAHAATRQHVSTYFGDENLLSVLGAKVIHGRALRAQEMSSWEQLWRQDRSLPPVVITQQLAQRLFPGQSAVGQVMHGPTRALRIVGVVDRLPLPLGSLATDTPTGNAMWVPVHHESAASTRLLIRTTPGYTRAVAAQAHARLSARFPGWPREPIVTVAQLRPQTLQAERRNAITLSVCAAGAWLLTLVSLGAAGLLWVQRGQQRISLHRAVGASRAQVRRAVRLEHLLWVTAGLVLGAVAIHWLLPRLALPWSAGDASVLAPWLAGVLAIAITQVIATVPARRAAAIEPFDVTRKPWVRL